MIAEWRCEGRSCSQPADIKNCCKEQVNATGFDGQTTTTVDATTTTVASAGNQTIDELQNGACRGNVGGLGALWRSMELGVLLLGGFVALMPTVLCGLRA